MTFVWFIDAPDSFVYKEVRRKGKSRLGLSFHEAPHYRLYEHLQQLPYGYPGFELISPARDDT
jgi:hypothetical protein